MSSPKQPTPSSASTGPPQDTSTSFSALVYDLLKVMLHSFLAGGQAPQLIWSRSTVLSLPNADESAIRFLEATHSASTPHLKLNTYVPKPEPPDRLFGDALQFQVEHVGTGLDHRLRRCAVDAKMSGHQAHLSTKTPPNPRHMQPIAYSL